MLESGIKIALGLMVLAFGLVTTFPKINSWKQLLFWMAVALPTIPIYAILWMLLRPALR